MHLKKKGSSLQTEMILCCCVCMTLVSLVVLLTTNFFGFLSARKPVCSIHNFSLIEPKCKPKRRNSKGLHHRVDDG